MTAWQFLPYALIPLGFILAACLAIRVWMGE